MTRWFPYPLLFAALLIFWLLLNQSISPGQILLGTIFAAAASWAMSALEPPQAHIKGRLSTIARLTWRVLLDIVASNIAVGRIILSGRDLAARSGFLLIPLDLRDHYGLAALACIISATPGTVWVNYDSAKSELLLHILDLHDESVWRHTIKQRYETLLMEIFE